MFYPDGTQTNLPWFAYFHFIPVRVSDMAKAGGVFIEDGGVSENASWNASSSSPASNGSLFELYCDKTALVGREV